MKPRALALAAAAAAVACAGAGAAAAPTVSNHGALLPLSPQVRAALIRRHRSPHIYRLATIRRLTFFRFGDSGRCYGATRDFSIADVAPATVPAVFGGVACWGRAGDLMDFSIVGASRAHPAMHLERVTGIAADGIRAVELVSAKGRVLAAVPVERNVYALWSVPRGAVRLRPVP
jgi:hypothetical protein